MAHVNVSPSAGMLWPSPRTVRFAGADRIVEPLRVRDIAAIEQVAPNLFGHPFRGMEESFAVKRAGRDEPGWIDHVSRIIKRLGEWPPRLGSRLFSEVLDTPEGFAAYLWAVLHRADPRLRPEAIPEIAALATAEEYAALSDAAWGRPSWALDEDAKDDGKPIPWGELASLLARQCGYTYPQIGEMFLVQFFNEVSEGKPRRYEISEPD